MSSNILDILSLYNQQTQNNVVMLNSIYSSKTTHLRRKRRKHMRTLAQLQHRQFLLVQRLLTFRDQKVVSVWSKDRQSEFWEKVVPENDHIFFKEQFRMPPHIFDILCTKLDGLKRSNTNYRKSVDLRKRIAIALYTLGSGCRYKQASDLFGVGKSTACSMLKNFCQEILKAFDEKRLEIDANKLEDMNGIALQQLKARFGIVEKELDRDESDEENSTIKVCRLLHEFLNQKGDYVNDSWLNGVKEEPASPKYSSDSESG